MQTFTNVFKENKNPATKSILEAQQNFSDDFQLLSSFTGVRQLVRKTKNVHDSIHNEEK